MIELRTSNLDELSKQLGRRKSHMETAMRRAVGSFVGLLRSIVLKEIRQQTGLPQSEMKRVRIRGKIVRRKMEATLWIGANPVAIRYLNPRFKQKGIKAGGKLYELTHSKPSDGINPNHFKDYSKPVKKNKSTPGF